MASVAISLKIQFIVDIIPWLLNQSSYSTIKI
jgi:hypothetical protein